MDLKAEQQSSRATEQQDKKTTALLRYCATALRAIFFVEILKGVTRRYPKVKRPVKQGFRGMHALVRDPNTGKEKCVSCLRCATVCPSQCIYIDYREQEDGSRIVEKYEIEALRCVYCGYCVEVCPVCALVLTEAYEYSNYSRDQFYFDRERLLKNWDEFTSKLKTDKYFNKFWRPEGIDVKRMPVGKRIQEPISLGYDSSESNFG
ncbi:MAG: NADH-quinone oxidoreductase subunit I [Nitrospirae bacterium]|nr:NADH-quinone oxidoreductase subunit I [Nitrospirota bacterium]